MTGISDSYKREVPETIIKCRKEGIKMNMVTGDKRVTVTTIVTNVEVWSKG